MIEEGRVSAVGLFSTLASQHPRVRVIGDGSQLVLPGLVDAHCHGRGLSPIQKGVPTDFLENALFDWAVMPALPPEAHRGAVRVAPHPQRLHAVPPQRLRR